MKKGIIESMQVKEQVALAQLTTMGVGGAARWFVEASREEEVAEAVRWAQGRGVPLFVLGGGSNLLVSDAGFEGLVLHMKLKGLAQQGNVFRAAAGEDWDSFVSTAVERNYQGVECLAGIPGTVGGTPVQNVGAYGQEVGAAIEKVRAFDTLRHSLVEFSGHDCAFGYRRSRFNTDEPGRFIVTRVDFRLKPGSVPQLSYADLKLHFQESKEAPTLVGTAAAVRRIRKSKGMLLAEGEVDCRSAGSFFKNPEVSEETAAEVKRRAGHGSISLRLYPASEGKVKIPAAWLIEHAGFSRGYVRGAVGISARHTLALINRGGAKASDIVALADEIYANVEEKFGIQLHMEPVRLGF